MPRCATQNMPCVTLYTHPPPHCWQGIHLLLPQPYPLLTFPPQTTIHFSRTCGRERRDVASAGATLALRDSDIRSRVAAFRNTVYSYAAVWHSGVRCVYLPVTRRHACVCASAFFSVGGGVCPRAASRVAWTCRSAGWYKCLAPLRLRSAPWLLPRCAFCCFLVNCFHTYCAAGLTAPSACHYHLRRAAARLVPGQALRRIVSARCLLVALRLLPVCSSLPGHAGSWRYGCLCWLPYTPAYTPPPLYARRHCYRRAATALVAWLRCWRAKLLLLPCLSLLLRPAYLVLCLTAFVFRADSIALLAFLPA